MSGLKKITLKRKEDTRKQKDNSKKNKQNFFGESDNVSLHLVVLYQVTIL